MEERRIKNKKFFSWPAKAMVIIVLFLMVGSFFAPVICHAAAANPPAANTSAAQQANADSGSCAWWNLSCQVASILTSIETGVLNVLGSILSLLMPALIFVAEYNAFTTSAPVTDGWVIVRDLCNMFFILILLLIAFATILRVEGYDIKKMVPKLVIMAILINFSKTICGLIIDFAQVIMNTFISPFAGIGSISMTTMLGLNTMSSFSSSGVAATQWSIFAAYAFALIYTLIAAVVLVVIFVVLVVRIVMLWIYIVLSPLSYLLATFPQGQRYVSQWWEEFTKNVIVGPVLAFFLWLSFVSLGTTNSGTNILGNGAPTDSLIKDVPQGLTGAMTLDQLIKFTISIGMLVGGLMVTQQMGGYMGKIAGQGMAKIQGGAKILGGGLRKTITGGLKGGADWLNIKAATHLGTPDLNLARQKERIGAAMKAGKARNLEEMEERAGRRLKAGGLVGATGVLGGAAGGFDAYTKGFLGLQGWGKQIFGGLRHGKLTTEGIVTENRDKEKQSLDMSKEVISESDYTKRRQTYDNDFTKTDSLLDTKGVKLTADLNQSQQDHAYAQQDLVDAGAKFGVGSDQYEKAEERKKKADADVKSKQELVDQNAEERQKVAGQHKSNIDGLENARSKAINTKDEQGRSLWITGPGDEARAKDRKVEYVQQARSFAEKAAGYTMMDFEGLAAMRKADQEAGKGITSRDENELSATFDVAVAQDNAPLARVLMEKLAGVNGTNFLFAQHGYQAKRGFNENEYDAIQSRIHGSDPADSQKAQEEYDNGKGTHDFIRDIFVGKLHMDKQRAFAFQNDVASIGEEKGADHLKKTIRVDSAGNYHQVTEDEQTEANQTENLKRDAETVFRKNNRLDFGAENSISKAFEFSASGLAYAMSNLGIIFKEMGTGRLNKSTAKAFSEPGAQNQLREMMRRLGIDKIKNGKDEISADDFLSSLRGFAAASTNDTVGKVLNIMRNPGGQGTASVGGTTPPPPPGSAPTTPPGGTTRTP